jgi:hypothetical protein
MDRVGLRHPASGRTSPSYIASHGFAQTFPFPALSLRRFILCRVFGVFLSSLLPQPARHIICSNGRVKMNGQKKDELISACFALSLLKLQLAGPGDPNLLLIGRNLFRPLKRIFCYYF